MLVGAIVSSNKSQTTIALSGGSTPKAIYALLAKQPVDFSNVTFYEVDERYVPRDHPNSNFKMINTALGLPLQGKAKGFVAFDTSLPIADCVSDYEQKLQQIPNQTFDLCILGMGPDGHIASLFPSSAALSETRRLTAHTTTDRFARRDRLTITLPMILASRKLLLLLRGADKQPILDALLHGSQTTTELPAKAILRHPDLTILHCQSVNH